MNEDVKSANEKEDKSKIKGFIVLMALCLVVGFICGFVVSMAGNGNLFADMATVLSAVIKFVSMYANLVLTIFSLIAVVILYRQSKSMFAAWDGEDDDVYKAFEKKLSIATIIVGVNQILFFVFMAVGIIRITEIKAKGTVLFDVISMVIFLVGIVASLIFTVIAQQRIVNLEKEINPEKRGSVFDTKFQKKWFESCDEAERQQIFEAAFASYKAVNNACMIIIFICLFGVKLWNFGVLPICIVGIIWLVSVLSYSIKCLEFESR